MKQYITTYYENFINIFEFLIGVIDIENSKLFHFLVV